MGKLAKLYQSCADVEEFVNRANGLNQGFTLEYVDGALFLVYPTCYCSCVKRVDKPVSRTWCYCTLGYTKKMFDYILGRDVSVSLIESVKTGGDVCRIRID